MWRPKQRQNWPESRKQTRGEIQEPAAVQCLGNSQHGCRWTLLGSLTSEIWTKGIEAQWEGKATKRQDYIWHLAVTSPLHVAKRKVAHSARRFDFLLYPLPIFCFFLFRFLESYLLYCLFNALLHRLKDLWMSSAAQHCWAIVLAVPEILQSLVMKVRVFWSTAMTPGGETQGSCSSGASVQIVFFMFSSSTSWWPRNKPHWGSLSLG